MATALDELNEALTELQNWTKGNRSFWNDCHGSVTGNYENQATLTIESDNAQKIALAARVSALTLLVQLDS